MYSPFRKQRSSTAPATSLFASATLSETVENASPATKTTFSFADLNQFQVLISTSFVLKRCFMAPWNQSRLINFGNKSTVKMRENARLRNETPRSTNQWFEWLCVEKKIWFAIFRESAWPVQICTFSLYWTCNQIYDACSLTHWNS